MNLNDLEFQNYIYILYIIGYLRLEISVCGGAFITFNIFFQTKAVPKLMGN